MLVSETCQETCLYKVVVQELPCCSLVWIVNSLVMGKYRKGACRPRKIVFPCAVCDKTAGVDMILCTGCGLWTHRSCTQLSPEDFGDYANL